MYYYLNTWDISTIGVPKVKIGPNKIWFNMDKHLRYPTEEL